mmetsp:Transcript_168/g.289  ORF Transcript_168/g.289 Transcript_168/m.289 type:complete len:208 (+) Transcript_168:537-1160(+)
MGDGDILEEDVEETGTPPELVGNVDGDLVTLGEEFVGIVAGHDGLGTLVHDAGEDALVVVLAEALVHPDELVGIRLVQDTHANGNHLQILGSRQGLEVARTGPNVVDDGPLEPGNDEIEPFAVHDRLHTHHPVEHHRAMTSLHRVHRVVRSVRQRCCTRQRRHRGSGRRRSTSSASHGHLGHAPLLHLLQALHRFTNLVRHCTVLLS